MGVSSGAKTPSVEIEARRGARTTQRPGELRGLDPFVAVDGNGHLADRNVRPTNLRAGLALGWCGDSDLPCDLPTRGRPNSNTGGEIHLPACLAVVSRSRADREAPRRPQPTALAH